MPTGAMHDIRGDVLDARVAEVLRTLARATAAARVALSAGRDDLSADSPFPDLDSTLLDLELWADVTAHGMGGNAGAA